MIAGITARTIIAVRRPAPMCVAGARVGDGCEGDGMSLPDVTIAMTTWAPAGEDGYRRSMAVKVTLSSWLRNLHYEGRRRIHIADDGSTLMDYPQMLGHIVEMRGIQTGEPWPLEFSRGERHGVGASLNRAFKAGFDRGDLVLYGVDDWMLPEAFDITPWAAFLEEREDVGMIRFFPHPDLSGHIGMIPGDQVGHYLRLDRHHYAFGHRPALYHRRMIDAYGWFAEDTNAYDCERIYNERFASHGGPDIVLALPHYWRHIGGTEFAGIEPREGRTE